jgi:hypothetical protein
MKKLITAVVIASALGTASAAQDQVFRGEDGKTVITVFDSSITKAGRNENGDVEVQFIAHYKQGKQFSKRAQQAVTCGTNGGYIGIITPDGTVFSQSPWVPDGPTLNDSIAERVCIRAIEKATGKQFSKTKSEI